MPTHSLLSRMYTMLSLLPDWLMSDTSCVHGAIIFTHIHWLHRSLHFCPLGLLFVHASALLLLLVSCSVFNTWLCRELCWLHDWMMNVSLYCHLLTYASHHDDVTGIAWLWFVMQWQPMWRGPISEQELMSHLICTGLFHRWDCPHRSFQEFPVSCMRCLQPRVLIANHLQIF